MYVGKKYTATRTEHLALEYRCKHCGYTVDVVVTGVGMGQAQSPFFLDNEGAAGRADEHAVANAGKNTELTLKLWPCPKCGKRDAAGFLVESAFLLAASAAMFAGIGFLVGSLKKGGPVWIFWIGAVLTPILLFYYGIQWKWTTAKDRVITVADLEEKIAEFEAAEASAAKSRRKAHPARRRRAKAGASKEALEAIDAGPSPESEPPPPADK